MLCIKSRVFKVCLLLIIGKGFEDLMGFVLIELDGLLLALAVFFVQGKLFGPLFIHLAEIDFGIKVKLLVFFLESH